MRIVRWESQERVDLPDMTALSFLVLGEFRKTIRDLALGFDVTLGDKFILRGFEVEPSAVPDTRIRVRMDTGDPDRIGTALLSENLGANTEYGQLAGGEDSAAALEGQAQQIIDFTGDPVATYVVEMRFVPYTTSTGANDNRAFWNPGINSEFIASTDTRFEPQWEVRRVGAATGGEWIPLASVTWDGVGPITTSEITDLRQFAFEGAAGSFDAATQAAYTALPDFSRSTLRGGLANGINEVYRVMRALGRQVADLKGQDELGNFNWYARAYGPTDAIDALADEQTRSLRTVDTAMFTVGDGVTTFGDFNGAAGLENCLQHIEDMGANTPSQIEIILKSRATASPGAFTFNITTAHSFNGVMDYLRIDAQQNDIACSHPAASIAIETASLTEVVIENVNSMTTSNNATLVDTHRLKLRNCGTISGDVTSGAEPVVAVQDGTVIRDIRLLQGRIEVTPRTIAAGIDDGLDVLDPVTIENISLDGVIDVNGQTAGDAGQPLHVLNSQLSNSRTHTLGGGNGLISALGANDMRIIDCTFSFNPDMNGIRTSNGTGRNQRYVQIRGCKFFPAGTPGTGGNHCISLGLTNFVDIDSCYLSVVDEECGGIELATATDVTIQGCVIRGEDLASRAIGVSALNFIGTCVRINVCNNVFDGWNPNTTVGNGRCIQVDAAATIQQVIVSDNVFQSNGGYCVQYGNATSVDSCIISGNSVYVPEAAGFGFDVEGWTRGVVNDNVIRVTTAASSGIFGGASGDGVASGNRLHNAFLGVAGAVLYGFSGGGGPTNLNYVT